MADSMVKDGVSMNGLGIGVKNDRFDIVYDVVSYHNRRVGGPLAPVCWTIRSHQPIPLAGQPRPEPAPELPHPGSGQAR